ncbi:MAG: hypothetical protein EA412_03285 [Chitinophagaceae bacterium]|nr:MAG: hypothetical protein EA412_03285 [Chitinophagaceae bacterium]
MVYGKSKFFKIIYLNSHLTESNLVLNYIKYNHMQRFKKFLALSAFVLFISSTLSSCHRDGCPNHITHDIEVTEERNI